MPRKPLPPVPKQAQNVTPQAGGWLSAALAVAAGQTATVAAAAAGVTVRTVRRWLKRPSFKAKVEEVRSQLVSDTLGRLLDKNAAAVDALAGLLSSQLENIKLAAASRLLELTLRARRQLDTERELDQVREDWEALRREHPEWFKGSTHGETTNDG